MAALPDTRMPSVITQEIPTLPPSIAVVPSAVPVFIGYTEKADKNGEDLTLKATRIRNIREFEAWFGTASDQIIEVDVNDLSDIGEGITAQVVSVSPFHFKMHYALQLYYANGGGPCFIVSVGPMLDSNKNPITPDNGDFIKGINAAKRAKDITIIALPDAVSLNKDDYGTVITEALAHCHKMINRVTVIDVADSYGEDLEKIDTDFRSKMPSIMDQKKYGAAYYPFLATTLNYKYSDTSASLRFHLKNGVPTSAGNVAFTAYEALKIAQKALKSSIAEKQFTAAIHTVIKELIDKDPNTDPTVGELKKAAQTAAKSSKGDDDLPQDLEDEFKKNAPTAASILAVAAALKAAAETDFNTKNTAVGNKQTDSDAANTALKTANVASKFANDLSFATIGDLFEANNLMYSKMKEAINNYPVIMPPSPAVAGLYVATDFSQGPWRAPANFSLAGVIKPTVEIDDDLHANLNVDSNAGKSINAIRSYVGKGVLVFGARTLAGNDLEWRYVNVRRTFCFIEDSVARAMQDFVFAPNIRDTWIKVKAMIGNFLNGIWQAGGLFGNTPDEAYQVSVGLPETMTDNDILEGRMIVVIKLRVSRPAEFIILRYEHKFQVSNN